MVIVIPGDGTPAPDEKLVIVTNVFDVLRRLAPQGQ
jgi:hypothetical protein